MDVLTKETRQLYESVGYAVIGDVLGKSALASMQNVLERVVEKEAQRLFDQGAITDIFEELPFEQRWPAIVEASGGKANIHWEHEMFTRELYELATNPVIIDTLKPLLGEDIIFNGDFHIRPKLPGSDYFPWHQDSQYYGKPTEPMHIVTVWVPFVDVHERNGCLSMLPGSQTWGVMDSARDAKNEMRPVIDPETKGSSVTEPMKAGDMMLFHNLTYHRSLPNPSNGARWSVDLRYSAAPREDMPQAEKDGYAFFMDKLRKIGFLTFAAAGANKSSWEEAERNYKQLLAEKAANK